MKFKQIRIQTSDIGRLIKYIFREDSSAQLVSTNILKSDYAKELSTIAAIRPDVKKAFEHWVLSFSHNDTPDMKTLAQITKKFISAMEMTPLNKHVATLHQDKEHLHVHILISRISTDGALWLGQHSVEKGMRITPVLEKEFGLTQTKSIEEHRTSSPIRRVSLDNHEFEQKKRTGLPTKKDVIVGYIENSIAKSDGTIIGFMNALKLHGVSSEVIERTNGSKGIRYTYNEITFKGSALGKGYSYTGIERALAAKSSGKDFAAPSLKSTIDQLEELKDVIEKNINTSPEEPFKLDAEFQKNSIVERLIKLKNTCPKELTYQITLLFYIVSAGLFNKHFYWILKEHVKRLELESHELARRLEIDMKIKQKSFIYIR